MYTADKYGHILWDISADFLILTYYSFGLSFPFQFITPPLIPDWALKSMSLFPINTADQETKQQNKWECIILQKQLFRVLFGFHV